jgi:hypothetical protein
MTDEVYVAEPRPSRPHDEADTYHTDEGCRTLARAVDYHAVSPAAVDGLELCDVCAGIDLCGAARVLAQADPDDYPQERSP